MISLHQLVLNPSDGENIVTIYYSKVHPPVIGGNPENIVTSYHSKVPSSVISGNPFPQNERQYRVARGKYTDLHPNHLPWQRKQSKTKEYKNLAPKSKSTKLPIKSGNLNDFSMTLNDKQYQSSDNS